MNEAEKLLSLHEAAIDQQFAREPGTGKIIGDAALASAAKSMAEARASWEQARTTWSDVWADESTPHGVRVERSRKAVAALATAAAKRLDGARSLLLAEVDKIGRETAPPPASQAGAEVRAVIREMKPEQRLTALSEAITDDDLMSALVSAHPITTGLNPDQIAALRLRWRRHRHPQAVDRETRIKGALAAIERAGHALGSEVSRLFDPTERTAEAAARARAAVEAAAKATTGAEGDQ